MEKLLNFEQPLDINLLDQAVAAFAEGNQQAMQVLVAFQKHPQSWTRVDFILQNSKSENTKVLALNILLPVVKFQWRALPGPQREGIKKFIVGMTIKLSSDPNSLKANRMMLGKLNVVLVNIVKQDWPQNWPSFIPDIVNSSKTNPALCQNNMAILRLLSEEIFDFSGGEMTQEMIKEKKKTLNEQFAPIFGLCDTVLKTAKDEPLITATLQTLQRFLQWIPVGYIFETSLIETLAVKLFPVRQFQCDTLQCLTEIASLDLKDHPQYNTKFVSLYGAVIQQTAKLLPPQTDMAQLHAQGNPMVQEFVRLLTVFLTGFLKPHLALLEKGGDPHRQLLLTSLTLLIRVSEINDSQIFKMCLEYWTLLVQDLYNSQRTMFPQQSLLFGEKASPRLQLYAPILSRLRLVMIAKMAKPEEVLIVEDENGDIVRETMADTEAIIMYKNMRECLIFLTHLDPQDTQEIMIHKLSKQVSGEEYSVHNLNTLCWAIGSVSGALTEMQEKSFLVRVVKDLLGLCEAKRGKDHKAVIASNIMYVVGQYSRFLRIHWKFLKTVVVKLFEFMHESHPGVQDMSCDTFVKIAKKCRKKFVQVQQEGEEPYIYTILAKLPEHIKDLQKSQVLTFYEGLSYIVAAEADPHKRQDLIFKLMAIPTSTFTEVLTKASHKPEILFENVSMAQVTWVFKANSRVAAALGSAYMVQLGKIYVEMLFLYNRYSQYIVNEIKNKGPLVMRHSNVKSARTVKKEVLKLVQVFIEGCADSDADIVMKNFLPQLMALVLPDYQAVPDEARDADVLSLFATVVTKFNKNMVPHVPKIFEAVFQSTIKMITKNFQDYPDHRICFFKLLGAITSHAFQSLLTLNPKQFQLIMDSVVWALKHMERNIADTGLTILLEIVQKMEQSEYANQFYKSYFVVILQDILGVLTDSFHKPGFRLHAAILMKLFEIVEGGSVTIPLGEPRFPNNQAYVRHFVVSLLTRAFPNCTQQQIQNFAAGLFQLHNNEQAFKEHLRDFLVTIKEYTSKGDKVTDLYLEERNKELAAKQAQEQQYIRSVPGLQYRGPSQVNGAAAAPGQPGGEAMSSQSNGATKIDDDD